VVILTFDPVATAAAAGIQIEHGAMCAFPCNGPAPGEVVHEHNEVQVLAP
jgi:hypothetical protein